MIQGWLVYNTEDTIKNSYFINALITYAKASEINLKLVLREKIALGMEENVLSIAYEGKKSLPQIVINRSRDSFFAKHLEIMGIRVYNAYRITHLCNHKARTHQMISQLGIPALNTFFYSKRYLDLETAQISFPVILKSATGHGGQEVFQCINKETIKKYLNLIKDDEFLIQQRCDQPGVDVRVFVMGDQILGAIKRESMNDFRSNYSLGGTAKRYHLSQENEAYVQRIIKHLKSDFVGIDFMINRQGAFLFNEIEDVVGSRTLYQYGQIDTAKEYIHYIKNTVTHLR
ncbi:ATP-grasp domain-containing protein [Cellulosilyticum sp. I15G10I2]|uniref:ATP-grasp domain-containing protein n=1 Tax=Cellulosilyticum sp. I15G10I2 TaxID=1892843 RepID=UPI00085BCA78|nr:RimK family alpha-L-glutamate ligase [Cellulosilyticum sp. I15G10I2]